MSVQVSLLVWRHTMSGEASQLLPVTVLYRQTAGQQGRRAVPPLGRPPSSYRQTGTWCGTSPPSSPPSSPPLHWSQCPPPPPRWEKGEACPCPERGEWAGWWLLSLPPPPLSQHKIFANIVICGRYNYLDPARQTRLLVLAIYMSSQSD